MIVVRSYYYHVGQNLTQWEPPDTAPRAPAADHVEAALESALGFVDPIVHAVATRILTDNVDWTNAVKRLLKHLPCEADAKACAHALLSVAAPSSRVDESSGDEDELSESRQSSGTPPWLLNEQVAG